MAKKKMVSKGAIVGGAALTAASVAALAGGYLLYGAKNAAKNRKKVKGWTLKAKGEILEKIEGLQDITENKYQDIVATVAKKYGGLKNIDPADLTALVNDAKKHWKVIHGQLAKKKRK